MSLNSKETKQANYGYINNNTEMYSTCNEGKSVVAERFITKLKNKIYKYMTAVSKKCIFIN